MLQSSIADSSASVLNWFYRTLNLQVDDRFNEWTLLIQRSASKDLQAIFIPLVSHLFELNLHITKESHFTEFNTILIFMDPHGSLFHLVYKLMIDCQAKFDFPISCLPEVIRNSLIEGKVPNYYSDLIHFDMQKNEIVAVKLNSFDYFMFNFAQYLTKENRDKFAMTKNVELTLYYSLFEKYLLHFLPIDPNYSITPTVNYFGSKNVIVSPTHHPVSKTPMRSSPIIKLPATSLLIDSNASFNQCTFSRSDVWRSETTFQAFFDLWICCENYQRYRPISSYFKAFDLPSSILVIFVRLFVKHLHAFASKQNNCEQCPLFDLKKRAVLLIQNRLYFFLNQLFHYWPMDSSFRCVLELWLSFIQPWRYHERSFDQSRLQNIAVSNDHVLDIEENTEFIIDNLLCYTNLFLEFLLRLLRMDLSNPKEALMVYRVTSVFDQENLSFILRGVEKELMNTSVNSLHCNSFKKSVLNGRLHILELEGPNYEYKRMFCSETKSLALKLLKHIDDAERAADVTLETLKKTSEKPFAVSSMIKSFVLNETELNDEFTIDERQKVREYLTVTKCHLRNLFSLSGDCVDGIESVSDNSSFLQTTASFGEESPQLKRIKSFQKSIESEGDPDLKPVHSHEVEFILKFALKLNKLVNAQFSNEFRQLYQRSDFVGRLSKQFLLGPRKIYVFQKNIPGQSQRVCRYLGPRISFRILANQYLIGAFVIITFCNYFTVSFPISIAIFLIFLKCVIIFVKAFFDI